MEDVRQAVGITEAMRITGYGRTWLLRLVHQGRIRAQKLPGRTAAWILNPEDVQAIADKRDASSESSAA